MGFVYGGGLTVGSLGATFADAASAPGNVVIAGYPLDHSSWPCLTVGDGSAGQGTGASRVTTGLYAPAYTTGVIMFAWDLAHLRAVYGPPPTNVTTVTVTVTQVFTNQTKYSDTPLDFTTANDLLACVPPKVTPGSALAIKDIIGQPVTSGFYYNAINVPLSGGVMAWPARPWSSTIGAGGWTLLSSYHITGDIRTYPPIGAGRWSIPVNLETHARDDKLVIVCATRPVFEQDDAGCAYWQDVSNPNAYYTRESWGVSGFFGAGLDWRVPSSSLSDLDRQGRVHFRPSGLGGDQRV